MKTGWNVMMYFILTWKLVERWLLRSKTHSPRILLMLTASFPTKHTNYVVETIMYKYHMFKNYFFANSFMRFRAEPALNQVICWSLKVWFRWIVSVEPSACLMTHSTGCKKVVYVWMENMSIMYKQLWLYLWDLDY